MINLKNKIVIITGGAGFLGVKHAEAIEEYGGIPILIDTNRKELEKIHKKRKWDTYLGSIIYEEELKNICNKILNRYEHIDVLINNATNNPRIEDGNGFSKLESIDKLELQHDIDVGLIGSILCTKVFGREMAKQEKGSIINIGSDLGLIGPNQSIYKVPKPVSYSVVKAGLIGLTKYTATYWANKNVRCNYLALGGVYNNQPKEFVNKLDKLIPLGRMAHEDEYKDIIAYLASDSSSYMTGAIIPVDGGRTCW